MFALWYLSLAFDEMRKRCGWIFFDIFKSKGPSVIASIDNKSMAVTNDDDTRNNAPTEMPASSHVNNNNVNNVHKPAAEMIKSPKTVIDLMPTAPITASVKDDASSMKDAEKTTSNGEMMTGTRSLNNVPSRSASGATASIAVPTSGASMRNSQEGSQQAAAKPTAKMFNDGQLMNNGTMELPEKPAAPPRSAVHIATKSMSTKKPQSTPSSPSPPQQQQSNDGMNDGASSSLQRAEFPMEHVVRRGAATRTTNDPKDEIKRFLTSEGVKTPSASHEMNVTKSIVSNNMVDAAVLAKLEEGFCKLAASNSKSLLKKYLTKEVFDNLKNKKTPTFGSTLLDCIQSGLENHDSGVGIYAPDAEAYSVFAELFDPIIEDYHGGFKKTDKHPPKNFGDVSVFTNVDPTNQYVISTRVRCGRSMQGYPFNPCLTEAQYKEMEQKVSGTLSSLEGELKGKFYPLTGMEKAVQQQLIDDHFLFKEGDRFLQAANACRFWPSGRGIYHNDNKTFLVWCNEEDHLRIISMQMGGDLGEVYRRLTTAVNEIEKRVPFSHDDRLGFLTFCPTNLGTTIRASVHIKVPKLATNKAKLEEVASKYNLQVRGTRGEHTEAEGGVYDISNKRRMGLTEFEAVKEMSDGITELIKLESSM